MRSSNHQTASNTARPDGALGWNPFASIVVVLCVPVIFWISALEALGAMFGFAVEPWMRSAVLTLAVVVIVPIWTGLWLNRAK